MSDKALSTPLAAALQEQSEPFDDTVGGSVTESEKRRIIRALDTSGWNQSRGVRTIMLAFTESAEVRDAVFSHIRQRHDAA